MATGHTLQGDNIEPFYLVWLDDAISKSVENIWTLQRIQLITSRLKTFHNVKDCEQYIRQTSKDDRMILIVSGQLGQKLVPSIHHYQQIFSIYVYCMDKIKNEEWAKHFQKVIVR